MIEGWHVLKVGTSRPIGGAITDVYVIDVTYVLMPLSRGLGP